MTMLAVDLPAPGAGRPRRAGRATRFFPYWLLMAGLLLTMLAPASRATPPERAAPLPLLSPAELDAYFLATLNRTHKPFDWDQAPVEVLWSGLRHSQGHLLLGYKPARLSRQQIDHDVSLL
jgi:hypothetical protein